MEYWAANPPTHVILAARYLQKPSKIPVNQEENIQELSMLLRSQAQKMPEEISKAIAWAEEHKLKIN